MRRSPLSRDILEGGYSRRRGEQTIAQGSRMLFTLQWTDTDPDAHAIRIIDIIPEECIQPISRDRLHALRTPYGVLGPTGRASQAPSRASPRHSSCVRGTRPHCLGPTSVTQLRFAHTATSSGSPAALLIVRMLLLSRRPMAPPTTPSSSAASSPAGSFTAPSPRMTVPGAPESCSRLPSSPPTATAAATLLSHLVYASFVFGVDPHPLWTSARCIPFRRPLPLVGTRSVE